MRIALAANAASGGGFEVDAVVRALREAGAEVDVDGCEPPSLERLAAGRPDRVVVAGGDGTIGAAAALAARLGVPLAVLPVGTANDFARANGLPADADAAAVLAVRGPELRRLDLGRLADGHPFVNVASAGMAATAARSAAPLKRLLGPLAYAAGALRAALSERPLEVVLRVDGAVVHSGACWQLMVAVTGAFGAGAEVREADPRDGRLDVVVVPAGSRLALARRAWGMRAGTLAAQRAVAHERGRVVEVEMPPGAAVNVDGEVRNGGLERVTVEPAAFDLVVG